MGRRSWGSGETQAAIVHTREYLRGESYTEKTLEIKFSAERRSAYVCKAATRGWGNNHPKR